MRGEDILYTLSTNLEPGRVQAQIDHTRMRLAQPKDQFPEVAVISDQYPLFTVRQGEDVHVFHRGGIVGSDPRHVMSERAQMACVTSVRTGVDQESHPWAREDPVACSR